MYFFIFIFNSLKWLLWMLHIIANIICESIGHEHPFLALEHIIKHSLFSDCEVRLSGESRLRSCTETEALFLELPTVTSSARSASSVI